MELYIIGIGPGSSTGMTGEARAALERAELIVGYKLYVEQVRPLFPEKEYYTNGMRGEVERVAYALDQAAAGVKTAVVCSGDAGVYGMAPLAFEMARARGLSAADIRVVPGVTAATSCGAVLGSPLSCDFAVISLSDLLVPWERIEKRLRGAAAADLPIVLYNPGSRRRADALGRACAIACEYKNPETVCAAVRDAGRDDQSYELLTLSELAEYHADMVTTVFIGSSDTYVLDGRMITPRGYAAKYDLKGAPRTAGNLVRPAGTSGAAPDSDAAPGRSTDSGTGSPPPASSGGSPGETPRNPAAGPEKDAGPAAGAAEEDREPAAGAAGRLLIFGGTVEGRRLAARARDAGYDVTLSVVSAYGRETAEREGAGIRILSGRMPAPEIEKLLHEHPFAAVIDATHPYAEHISGSIRRAAERAGIRRIRVRRSTENAFDGSDIEPFGSMEEIVDFLNHHDGRVFFSTGSGAAEQYALLDNAAERAVIRILPSEHALAKVRAAGFSGRNIICMQGPFTEEMNRACFRYSEASWLVTKSSGKEGGYDEKIAAARGLGMKILVLTPPETEDRNGEVTFDEAMNIIGEKTL